ncbi:MAG: DNA mismatch repair protein MutS [Cyclobacteriaceae bacterium]
MKQYFAIKAKYPGAMLLFRVGDFYETFEDDAVKASKILGITLTKRANGAASSIALAGFPYHSLDTYLPKLVRAGQRVAICDQLEDAKGVKGIVKRGVTELVTPGISFNDNVLEVKRNNYLAAIQVEKEKLGIALLDISTGEFFLSEGNISYIAGLIENLKPSEVIFSRNNRSFIEDLIGESYATYALDEWACAYEYAYEKLTEHFKVKNLKGYGVENHPLGIMAAGSILHYLSITEHKKISHIQTLSRIEADQYVWLDKFTAENLELLHSRQDGGVPLIDVIDATQTPMGGRLLRKWVMLPLKSKQAIDERLSIVAYFKENPELLEEISEELKHIPDLERLIAKVAAQRVNPREIVQLKKALMHIEPIKKVLSKQPLEALEKLSHQLDPCVFLRDKIEQEVQESPPLVTNQGNIFQDGINTELDELRDISSNGKGYLAAMQQREMERTGIAKIKVAYNKVFGYYLEVSNAQKDKVPEDWIRKQTLVNAERFITEELKEYEEKILSAEGKINSIEFTMYQELVADANAFVTPILQDAHVIGQLDCLIAFAQLAIKNNYIKPQMEDHSALDIKSGRHPVIEQQLPTGEDYIPNDIYLDTEDQQVMIITGPNMAGKSALLRQTALIVLMAQIGSFVPAKEANIGIVDKVFTRVGASDNLSKGESTFMVEMTETASILNNLSDRSLVLMDEIGRGTSTYDGISIAWSIVEFLHNQDTKRAKTLFATHYHELNQLEEKLTRVKNFNVSVKETGDKIIFLRKLKKGGSEHSFGIHVAQLAGMPQQIVLRADEILRHLEKEKVAEKNKEKLEGVPIADQQLMLFDAVNPELEKVKDKLEQLDINTLSPVEALLKLNELKGILN